MTNILGDTENIEYSFHDFEGYESNLFFKISQVGSRGPFLA